MSTEEKAVHTPGPWFVVANHTNALDIMTVPESDDVKHLIANITNAEQDDFGEDAPEWANARLIASAPTLEAVNKELLQALEKLRTSDNHIFYYYDDEFDYCRSCEYKQDQGDAAIHAPNCEIGLAEAVIAKACGIR